MPYYKVILCDGDTETQLSMDEETSTDLPAPRKGDPWPVRIDCKQIDYEVIELGEPKLVSYRELRVKRP